MIGQTSACSLRSEAQFDLGTAGSTHFQNPSCGCGHGQLVTQRCGLGTAEYFFERAAPVEHLIESRKIQFLGGVALVEYDHDCGGVILTEVDIAFAFWDIVGQGAMVHRASALAPVEEAAREGLEFKRFLA